MANKEGQGDVPGILAEKDERLLNYLALIAQIIQRQVDPPEPQREKRFRDVFREPSVVATLITVLIGGIAATGITGIIQWRAGVREFNQSRMSKEREFEQAWLKSRGDQALLSYKEYLDQEQGLIRRTYGLIGTTISASDRLKGLTKDSWRLGRFFGTERVAVNKQMGEIYGITTTKRIRSGIVKRKSWAY
jgi:hypothetical protein